MSDDTEDGLLEKTRRDETRRDDYVAEMWFLLRLFCRLYSYCYR